jgi:phosphopantetheinyl transferase (holo-ACP synthase)
MIGNDIVDLVAAKKESNWKRAGFLDKIFTEREQLLILSAENPEQLVWDLWSRKEAAYKIYNRQTGVRAYIPLQLECYDSKIENGIRFGKVVCNSQIYYTKTEISEANIHSIAVTRISDFDSIQYLENNSNIQKTNGIPNWIDKEKSVLKPVSISHHGRFTRRIGLFKT